MRILVLTIDYPPMGGGISRWTRTLVDALARHRVVVLAPEFDGRAGGDLGDSGASVIRGRFFARVPASWNPVDLFAFAKRARKLVRDECPDLVIAAQAGIPGLVGGHLCRAFRVPLILVGHGEELERARRSRWRRAILRRAIRTASLVIANSRSTTDQFIALGAPRDKLRRWAAVDPDRWKASASTEEAQDSVPLVLCVGRFDARKGQGHLLSAWPSVLRSCPRARCRFVGSGPEEKALRDRIRETPALSSVEIQTLVPDSALKELYRRCAVFVLPSRRIDGEEEGLGLVFLEAALFGKPSVAGRVGGVGDAVLDGKTGLLVDSEKPEEIARAIVRLLGDDDLRARMGRNAFRRVHRRFALPVAAVRLEGWLDAVRRAPAWRVG
jgi:phosphatidylinositol alpha-1,6-mannosyltransferase